MAQLTIGLVSFGVGLVVFAVILVDFLDPRDDQIPPDEINETDRQEADRRG